MLALPDAAPWRRMLTGRAAVGVLCVGSWWILAASVAAHSGVVPNPLRVAAEMWTDRAYLAANLVQTGIEAAAGLMLGIAVAALIAAGFAVSPRLERISSGLLVAVYCVPLVAVAPIATALFPSAAAISVVSAQAVVFVAAVVVLDGLRSVHPALVDVVHAMGGGRRDVLLRLRLRAALPALLTSLDVTLPAALVGAIIGEFAGAERGLGAAMLTSLQAFDVARVWALAVVMVAAVWLVGVVVGALRQRAALDDRGLVPLARPPATPSLDGRGSRRRTIACVAWLVPPVVWWVLVSLPGMDPFFAKSPLDVWRWVVSPGHAGQLLSQAAATLADASLGFIAGLGVAILLGAFIAISPTASSGVTLVARAARSIPLTATAPLLALALGHGTAEVLAITTILVTFPALVVLLDGIRSVPRALVETVDQLGGSRLDILLKVRLAHGIPALRVMLRLLAPMALQGALLAEWLVTGQGLGGGMVLAVGSADYAQLWAEVAAAVCIGLASYHLAAFTGGRR